MMSYSSSRYISLLRICTIGWLLRYGIVIILLSAGLISLVSSVSPAAAASLQATRSNHRSNGGRSSKWNTTSRFTTSYDDLSLYDVEYHLALQEQQRTYQLYQKLQQKGYEIYGFYHTSTVGEDWQYVLREQLLLMDGRRKFPSATGISSSTDKTSSNYTLYEWDMVHRYSSLLEMSIGLYVNVAGTDTDSYEKVHTFISKLPLTYKHKIILQFSKSLDRGTYQQANEVKKKELEADLTVSEGEGPTITQLYQFCKQYTAVNDYQIYGHTIENLTDHSEVSLQKYQKGIFYELYERQQQQFLRQKQGNAVDSRSSTTLLSHTTSHTSVSSRSTSKSSSSTTSKSDYIPKQRAIIYYLHAKRTCCITGNGALWREYMDAINVEFPSICLRALGLRKYSVCGTQRANDHYSGNFWYSECEHISQLFIANRFDWLGAETFSTQAHHFGEAVIKYSLDCAYSFAYYHRNLYDLPLYRYEYLEKLWYTITSPSYNYLPASDGEVPYDEIQGMKRFCSYIKKPHHYHDLITYAPFAEDNFQKLQIAKNGQPTPRRKSYYDLNSITWHYALQKQIPKKVKSN